MKTRKEQILELKNSLQEVKTSRTASMRGEKFTTGISGLLQQDVDPYVGESNTSSAIKALTQKFSGVEKENPKIKKLVEALRQADLKQQDDLLGIRSDFSAKMEGFKGEITAAEERGTELTKSEIASILDRIEESEADFDEKLKQKDSQSALLEAEVSRVSQELERIGSRKQLKDPEIAEVKKLLDDLEKKLWDRIRRIQHGGGNMNRNIALNGNTSVLSRYTDVNWKAGTNITLTAVKNDTTKYTDITISATGGGSFAVLVPTGTVNGTNKVFTFTSAPSVVVLDNGNIMNQVSSDGTINWTGTTIITLSQAPNFNIYGF